MRRGRKHLLRLYRGIFNRLRYGRSAPRFAELIFINPREVTLAVGDAISRELSGAILDGDWDKRVRSLHALEKYEYCIKHFALGMSWQEAGAYRYMENLMATLNKPDGCRSMNDVVGRFTRLDSMYRSLKKGGAFKTQRELLGTKISRRMEEGGVYIHIGRGGEKIFGLGGFHRLAIAKVLDMHCIPAQLGVVHPAALKSGVFDLADLRLDRRNVKAG